MKVPSEIIMDLIASSLAGEGWIKTKNLFVGHEPETPANVCTIFDYEAGVQNPKLNYDMLWVQVRMRGQGYLETYRKLKKISLLLNGISPFNSGTDRVEGIWIQNPVTPLGRDSKNNFLFTINFRILIIPAEAGHRQ
jgi:hypothetical protein